MRTTRGAEAPSNVIFPSAVASIAFKACSARTNHTKPPGYGPSGFNAKALMIGPYGLNTFLNDVDVTPIGIFFTYTLLSSFADRSNFVFGAFVAVSPSDATFAPGFLRGLRVAFAAGASLSTASPSVVAAAIDIGGITISTSRVPSPAIAPSFAPSSPSSSRDDPLRNLTPRADGAIARAAAADAPRVDVTDADVDARAIDVHAVRAARRNDIVCERARVELCGAAHGVRFSS
jgi:hypothetical protein